MIRISPESVYRRLVWIKTSQEENGLGNIHFPLAKNVQVSKSYGVLIEGEGVCSLLLAQHGNSFVQTLLIDNNFGRNIDEALRALQIGGVR